MGKYVVYYDESVKLAKKILGENMFARYKKYEYIHRQNNKNPKSFIVESPKMKDKGYRLVFFTNLSESSVRFDKAREVGNRGDNLIPENLVDVSPYEYTNDEFALIYNNIVEKFSSLEDNK